MSNISHYLNQTASRASGGARDAYGKIVDVAIGSIAIRLQESNKRTRIATGEEIGTDAEAWIEPTQEMRLNDSLTLEGTKYRVVKVDTKRLLGGQASHKKLLLIRAL